MKTVVVKAAWCAAFLLFILVPGLAVSSAQAAPADAGLSARLDAHPGAAGVEKARVVCGAYRCWRQPGWGYGPRRDWRWRWGGGYGWRGYGWRPHPHYW